MPQDQLDSWLLNASKSGDTESIIATVEAGADVNVTDEYGCSPLMYVISSFSSPSSCEPESPFTSVQLMRETANILIGAGALEQISAVHLDEFLSIRTLNRFARNYARAHVLTAMHGMSQEQLDRLLLGTASLSNINDETIWTVETLIRAGADVHVTDKNCTPLKNAAGGVLCGNLDRYHYPIIERLLGSGIDLNSLENPQKNIFLKRASEFGHIDHVRGAINAGADVNGGFFVGVDFRTPLFHASENCHEDIVRVLIIAGAIMDHIAVLRGREWTALDIAKENCAPGTIRVLQDAGASPAVRPIVP